MVKLQAVARVWLSARCTADLQGKPNLLLVIEQVPDAELLRPVDLAVLRRGRPSLRLIWLVRAEAPGRRPCCNFVRSVVAAQQRMERYESGACRNSLHPKRDSITPKRQLVY